MRKCDSYDFDHDNRLMCYDRFYLYRMRWIYEERYKVIRVIIELKDACKIIKGITVLDHISYELKDNRVYGLQGPNGSGKSMLIRAICGLIHLTSGQVIIDGKVVGKEIEFPESVGLLLERPAFLGEYSGFDNLKMIAAIQGKVNDDMIRSAIEEVGLDPNDKKKYRKYSLGMKQRLGIAGAIMMEPKLLILDEPTNALDVDGIALVRDIIGKRIQKGRIIIIASHDREEMERITDEVLYMKAGRLLR